MSSEPTRSLSSKLFLLTLSLVAFAVGLQIIVDLIVSVWKPLVTIVASVIGIGAVIIGFSSWWRRRHW